MDQLSLRRFDPLCLPPVEPLKPAQIKHIREASRVSQAVFARLVNSRLSTVQGWEIGQKKPIGTAFEMLFLAHKSGLQVVLQARKHMTTGQMRCRAASAAATTPLWRCGPRAATAARAG